jgi:hypothetical protein
MHLDAYSDIAQGDTMLVIGFKSKDNSSFNHELDIDPTIDSPRHIHDLLKKAANGADFGHIVVVENDIVVAEFSDEEDYDLTEPTESDDEEDDEDNEDSLHEEDDSGADIDEDDSE